MTQASRLTLAARRKRRGFRGLWLEHLRRSDMRRRRVALSALPAVVTLEMTARCNLVCVTCRRYHVPEEHSTVRGVKGAAEVTDVVGSSGYLEPEIFARALALVRDASSVELTGYGEPMLNPHFHDYARALKERGHRLSTITNGTLLNERNLRALIRNRFDLVSVSIDGVEAETLAAIRGVERARLFASLEQLRDLKAECGLGRRDPPRLGACFVMARFNIREMPALVRALADLGLDHFYAQNLEASACPEMLGPYLLHTDATARAEAMRRVEETRRVARERGVRVSITPIPAGREGWEPPGADLDTALGTLRRAAARQVPPPRRYRSLADIRAEQAAPLDPAAAAAAAARSAGVVGLAARESAALVRLPERLVRENRRCLDFFRYAYVAWNGKVLSCCLERHAVGDLHVEDAASLWNGPVYRRLRRACFEQGIRSVCPGCSRILE